MTPDPIARFRRWYEDARRAGAPAYDAMAVATADTRGRPSVRMLLLKGVDPRGFVFFTHRTSRKGRELEANPHAALAFYWERLGRQVRVEGRVAPVAPEEADAYWSTRPRESRLGALASRQSRPLARRRDLLARVARLERRYAGREIPRPAHWIGFRLVPDAIEFWTQGKHRLHHRERFTRAGAAGKRSRSNARPPGWRRQMLQP
ncbi:MAG: pyridoxamine 5'-phosphate oxidase [Planctomycetes bacterium]|nr:pyridoxamine 5'-phosphate oxidase [Planctomycetota bacterium]